MIAGLASCSNSFPVRLNAIQLGVGGIRFSGIGENSHPVIRLRMIGANHGDCGPRLVRIPPCLSMHCLPRILGKKHLKGVRLALSDRGLPHVKLARASICLSHRRNSEVSRRGRVAMSTILLPSFSSLSIHRHNVTPRLILTSSALFIRGMNHEGGSIAILLKGTNQSALRIHTLRLFGGTLSMGLNSQGVTPSRAIGVGMAIRTGCLGGIGDAPQVLLVAGSPTYPGGVVAIGMAGGRTGGS